jgi:heterotetrameric sarcosine oxidase gamma subunit
LIQQEVAFVVDLVARSACIGLLPLSVGDVTLSEVTPGAMTSIAPFKGHDTAASSGLKAAHGMAMPAFNRATGKAEARAIWLSRGQVMLVGPYPDASLSGHAAMTDQADAWAVVRLEGAGSEDVLARLIPVDVRVSVFKRGHTMRTDLLHMMASVTRIGDTAFQIMVFRSMAETLVHDLKSAMEGVASRR